MSRIKNFCTIYTGNSISDNEKDNFKYANEAIPYISTKDIDINTKNINYENGMYVDLKKYKYKIAPKHSTLLCIEGGSAGKKIGYLNQDVCFVNKLCCFSNFKGNSKFLYYYLQSDNFISNFNLNISGLIGGVSQSIISNMEIVVPSISKQNKIADYLDKQSSKLDDIIEGNKKEIELLEEYKNNLISKIVFNGLDNVNYNVLNLPWLDKIPNTWHLISMRGLFEFRRGLSITKDNLIDNGISVISYGQIHSKLNDGTKILDSFIRYVADSFLETDDKCLVEKNDFIFADTSEDLEGCGNSVFIDRNENIFAGYHTIIVHPIKEVSKYYAYLFSTDKWRSQIRSLVNGVKLYSITQKILKSCKVISPPLEKQIEIVNYLDNVCSKLNKIISYRKQIIEKLEEYKKSLIYEVVTGKKEV